MVRRTVQNQAKKVKQSSDQPAETKMPNGPGRPRENWSISSKPTGIGRSQGTQPDHWTDGRPRYIASWDGIERPLPDLPLKDLLKGLFPSAFPSRIESPEDLQSSSVLDLPRLGRTLKPNGSAWTEVAMHLTEDLQPGHY